MSQNVAHLQSIKGFRVSGPVFVLQQHWYSLIEEVKTSYQKEYLIQWSSTQAARLNHLRSLKKKKAKPIRIGIFQGEAQALVFFQSFPGNFDVLPGMKIPY